MECQRYPVRREERFLDWLISSGADLVAIQETKAHPGSSPRLFEPAWLPVRLELGREKRLQWNRYVHRLLPHKRINGLGHPLFDMEGRTLILEFEPFVFFNTYFPNGGRGAERVEYKLAFYRYFLDVARGYMKAGRSVVITGDLNTAYAEIDLARPERMSTIAVSCRRSGPDWVSFLRRVLSTLFVTSILIR